MAQKRGESRGGGDVEPGCQVTEILPEDQGPEDEQEFIALNYDYEYDSSGPGDNK